MKNTIYNRFKPFFGKKEQDDTSDHSSLYIIQTPQRQSLPL